MMFPASLYDCDRFDLEASVSWWGGAWCRALCEAAALRARFDVQRTIAARSLIQAIGSATGGLSRAGRAAAGASAWRKGEHCEL
jgi:hypothetical protein